MDRREFTKLTGVMILSPAFFAGDKKTEAQQSENPLIEKWIPVKETMPPFHSKILMLKNKEFRDNFIPKPYQIVELLVGRIIRRIDAAYVDFTASSEYRTVIYHEDSPCATHHIIAHDLDYDPYVDNYIKRHYMKGRCIREEDFPWVRDRRKSNIPALAGFLSERMLCTQNETNFDMYWFPLVEWAPISNIPTYIPPMNRN